MLFHFLNISQCVVCMFGHKKDLQSYKSQRPLQREIFHFFLKSLFKNYNERLVWTTVLCSGGFVISQSGPLEYHSNKSCLRKFEWLGGGEGRGSGSNAWLSASDKTTTKKMCCFSVMFSPCRRNAVFSPPCPKQQ